MQQVFEWGGGAKEECVKENFLLNYFLFNLFLFLQKSGGGLKPPPAPPSAQSLVMCYNSFFACSYNNLNTSFTEAKPWKIKFVWLSRVNY